MPQQFQIGDVVQLKSGGPTMTVVGEHQGDLLCRWFANESVPKDGSFPAAALKPYAAR